jgi:hypothetical protein
MAARRHARKVTLRRAARCAGLVAPLVAPLVALAFAFAGPIVAATTEQIVVDRNSGLAIHGFDPIAYFTDATPSLGRGEFEYRHAGVVWRFRNAGNLAAFAADPDVYMPRFGGYDPVAVSRGLAVAGDPRIWIIIGQRLYLFHTAENRALFSVDGERFVAAADETWPAVSHTLSP